MTYLIVILCFTIISLVGANIHLLDEKGKIKNQLWELNSNYDTALQVVEGWRNNYYDLLKQTKKPIEKNEKEDFFSLFQNRWREMENERKVRLDKLINDPYHRNIVIDHIIKCSDIPNLFDIVLTKQTFNMFSGQEGWEELKAHYEKQFIGLGWTLKKTEEKDRIIIVIDDKLKETINKIKEEKND